VAKWREGAGIRSAALARCGYHPLALLVDRDAVQSFTAAFQR
jgi:hypothetical protein